MKKLITYILLTFFISITLGSSGAYALTKTVKTHSPDSRSLVADEEDARDFQPSPIPQPTLLPGPSEESQKSGESRNFFTEDVLPKFALGTIGLVGGLSLLFLVIAGGRYATAYGNEENVEKAKNQAIYSVIGLLIALLSVVIVVIVANLFEDDEPVDTETATETTEDAEEMAPGDIEYLFE